VTIIRSRAADEGGLACAGSRRHEGLCPRLPKIAAALDIAGTTGHNDEQLGAVEASGFPNTGGDVTLPETRHAPSQDGTQWLCDSCSSERCIAPGLQSDGFSSNPFNTEPDLAQSDVEDGVGSPAAC